MQHTRLRTPPSKPITCANEIAVRTMLTNPSGELSRVAEMDRIQIVEIHHMISGAK